LAELSFTGSADFKQPTIFMKTLNELFIDELADMYDAERRILKAATNNAPQNSSNSNKEMEGGRAKRPATAGRARTGSLSH
jgi:hypothetical protein